MTVHESPFDYLAGCRLSACVRAREERVRRYCAINGVPLPEDIKQADIDDEAWIDALEAMMLPRKRRGRPSSPKPPYTPSLGEVRIRSILSSRYPYGYPHGGLKEIGKEVGLTHERVRQIAVRMGLSMQLLEYWCPLCRESFSTAAGRIHCPRCRPDQMYVTLNCDSCGKEFQRSKADYEGHNLGGYGNHRYTGKVFCNRKCFGAYMGKTVGWGSPNHPIHQGKSHD